MCRVFRALSFETTQIMNLTDIDDKTIRGAVAEGLPLREFTAEHIATFFEDLEDARRRPGGALSARHGPHPRNGRAREEARGPRAHLRERRLGLVPHRDVSGLRKALEDRPLGREARRARGRRRVREGGRPRLRRVEGGEGGRARVRDVDDRARPREARLAPRVQRDVDEVPRRDPRHPHRRRRQHLPAPRERDRAERRRDREDRSSTSGSTPSTSSWTARRCRRARGTSTRFPTSSRRASRRARSATSSSRFPTAEAELHVRRPQGRPRRRSSGWSRWTCGSESERREEGEEEEKRRFL